MAQFDISGSVDPLLSVTLNKGESLFAESNAMVAMDGTLSLSGRTKGGCFKSLARKFLNDETFFQQKITAEDEGGRALLGNSGGLFVMATEGEGRVAVSGFGSVRRIDIADSQKLIVDNGHLPGKNFDLVKFFLWQCIQPAPVVERIVIYKCFYVIAFFQKALGQMASDKTVCSGY